MVNNYKVKSNKHKRLISKGKKGDEELATRKVSNFKLLLSSLKVCVYVML